ncbi:hypothetical protein BKA63DRAFT_299221 [Paraphoma chrysanthemicola]|nr:hypothetical protein BKA63DRAFT_299221 [Paraphoma chrysanthemicola]
MATITQTQTHTATKSAPDLSAYPQLTKEQAGHVRHFLNLVAQPDGSWNNMGGLEGMQEFNDAYRYQLATMAYAIGITHFHRNPALRSVYKPLFRRVIHKMLLKEVWGYWFMTSHSGNFTEPDRTELRKPWADPVKKENIMYSGHLLLMTSLYAMLFDDDEFEKPGSIKFTWDPLFWGMGTEVYEYDNRSLQNIILNEMEGNGWVGVCCEPNLVFVVCNQFPIIAVRYNDIRDGTNRSAEVTRKYLEAWDKKGMVQSDGMFVNWIMMKQDMVIPPANVPYGAMPPLDVGFTAWACAFMHAWNPSLVRSLFDAQSLGHITRVNNKYRVHPTTVAAAFRHLVSTQDADPNSEATLEQALKESHSLPPSPIRFLPATFGVVTQWLSELGKAEILADLFEYADEHLNPTWDRGGMCYPRQDEQPPNTTDIFHMDPFSGNALMAYARLNVPNGQNIMYTSPWTKEELEKRPYIDGVTMDDGVDYLRGGWDCDKEVLFLTAKTWDGRKAALKPVARNLAEGKWDVYVDQQLVRTENVREKSGIEVEMEVSGKPVDVVFVRGS